MFQSASDQQRVFDDLLDELSLDTILFAFAEAVLRRAYRIGERDRDKSMAWRRAARRLSSLRIELSGTDLEL